MGRRNTESITHEKQCPSTQLNILQNGDNRWHITFCKITNHLTEGCHKTTRSPLKNLIHATKIEAFTTTKNEGIFINTIFVAAGNIIPKTAVP